VCGQSRRAAGPSDDEKEEDLEMSKELVDVLIKEVYNKLLKDVGPKGVKNVSNYTLYLCRGRIK